MQENLPTFIAFVDLKKAFDSVDRDLLWHRLGHYGISGKFLDLIKCLYRDAEYCVRVNDTVTEPFPVTSGVKVYNHYLTYRIQLNNYQGENIGLSCTVFLVQITKNIDPINHPKFNVKLTI